MLIRRASLSDSQDILTWRNDAVSRNMFFDSSKVIEEDHTEWFEKSLLSEYRAFFIGETDQGKLGVCRFDLNEGKDFSEVSINMNPLFRGRGLASLFLLKAIEEYWKNSDVELVARVKSKNTASLKLFERVGFYKTHILADEVCFTFPKKQLKFVVISPLNTGDLYELLGQRKYGISHKSMPSYSEHESFVKMNPYLHWYLILQDEPIGTFYIQEDNSIGLNFPSIRAEWVSQTLKFILRNFSPNEAVPSKVPSYFYLNTAAANSSMIETLEMLGLKPLQVSHQLTQPDEN